MPNFSAKIVNNAVGALIAQQAVIATTGNNIANVNTPGYSKRTISLETRVSSGEAAGVQVGNGVAIGDVQRLADSFIEKVMRDAKAEESKYGIEHEFMERVGALFSLTGDQLTVGSAFTEFLSAVDDLTTNPASIELRTNLIERANDLTQTINFTYNELANLQKEADERLTNEVSTVNTLGSQIAELNAAISSREASGNIAADERDQRELLLQKLSEKIGYTLTEVSDGSVNVVLSNGFALVTGNTSKELEVMTSPSFSTGSEPASLWNGTLSYIVYDYDPTAGGSHLDLTGAIKSGGGTIGGLLTVRGANAGTSPFHADGPIVETATRIEAFTRRLLTQINEVYLGPDADNSGATGFQPGALDLDGNAPAVYGLFTFPYTGNRDTDTPADSIPDDLGTHGLDNYSSVIRVAITDPRDVAAAWDNDVGPAVSFAQGDGRNIQNVANQLRAVQTSFSAGSFSMVGTFEDLYGSTVTLVSNHQSTAELNLNVAESKFVTAAARRDEISAVSLDEEFTNLIKFQKAYEASARMVRIAEQLLDEILQLI